MRSMKFLTIPLVAFTLAACEGEPEVPVTDQSGADIGSAALVTAYTKLGNELIGAVEQGDQTTIVSNANQMVDYSINLVDRFREQYPECDTYLRAVKDVVPRINTISAEVLEKDYHQDGALGEMPSETCYHAKDLLVHPASVIALMREQPNGYLEAVEAEITEVLAHMDAVKDELNIDSN